MSEYFDSKEDIRQAVRLRLQVEAAADLPTDGTAGPQPFDIVPVEKWLYEGYARHYHRDEIGRTAFWSGIADVLEDAIPPTSEARIETVKRCANLLDQLANNFGVTAIQATAMAGLLKRPATSSSHLALSRADALSLEVALLRIFLLVSSGRAHPQLLQAESDTWTTLHANVAAAPSPFAAAQSADAVCVLFRAWALMRRRNPHEQAIVRGWCQSGPLDITRLLAYMKRTHTLLKASGAYFDPAIWAALESCVTGARNLVGAKPSGVPRFSYAVAANQQPMLAAA
jgi:hypothetical protein